MKSRLITTYESGVATSQTVASKIQSVLGDDGVAFPVEVVDYRSTQNEFLTAGIYVYVAQPDEEVSEQAEDLGIEVFPGIPFLIGMGMEPTHDGIKELVQ